MDLYAAVRELLDQHRTLVKTVDGLARVVSGLVERSGGPADGLPSVGDLADRLARVEKWIETTEAAQAETRLE